MENKGVDNIIKQKLQNFEVDLNPTDWQFMEEMLDAEESDIIDETAKEKLEDQEMPLDVTSWAIMDLALDDLAEAESVDEIVEEKLQGFEVAYNAADWSIMEAMLDAEISNEVDDELARRALADYSVPFSLTEWERMDMELDDLGFPNEVDDFAKRALKNYESAMPSDWEEMETVLVSAEKMRRQLVITKSIEVALFIFAIWTIGNFLPFKNENTNTIFNNDLIEELDIVNNQSQTNTDNIDAATINDLENGKGDIINNKKANSNDVNENTRNLNFLPKKNIIIPPLEEVEVVPTIESENKPMANLNRILLEEQLVTYPNGKGLAFRKSKSKSKEIGNEVTFLDLKKLALISEDNFSKVIFNENYKKEELRFRVAFAPEYSFFSNDENLNTRKVASGISTNVGIDYAISDKVEISSGVSYNRKAYVQQQQEEFTGAQSQFTLNSVRDIELEVVQVPLHVNYNIIKNEKTRLYVTGGATAGLIMKVEKNTKQVSLANSVYNLNNSNFEANAQNGTVSIESKGALQNGEINKNMLVTADLGLGLEYQASPRLSFFIEPLYQRSLNKIGVDGEDYQNYAFSIGSRVLL